MTYILTIAIITLCIAFATYAAKGNKETNLLIKRGESLLKAWEV